MGSITKGNSYLVIMNPEFSKEECVGLPRVDISTAISYSRSLTNRNMKIQQALC